jgi:SAM-dependent methyltransferase
VSEPSPHVRENRRAWDAKSEWYQTKHGQQLNHQPLAWGAWAVPEAEVGALGDVEGKVVLELGCGGGQWSMFLAEVGACPVGLDLSGRQLAAARKLMRTAYPLLQGDAEQLPLRDASVDVVVSDHGAMSWADPHRTVPEVARVLRPGGRFAFNTTTPWPYVCLPEGEDLPAERLVNPYFGLHRWDEGDGSVTFVLGYGEWVRLLRRWGLAIEDHIELRPPANASTTYDMYVSTDWARRWPAEAIWVTTRR